MKQQPIKKLTKEEVAEGLTLDLVNSIDMSKNYSPIQLQEGDEPCNILQCSKGYWVMIDSKPLVDEKNQYIVWDVRKCQIGRARYLLNYGAKEKEVKIRGLIASWKNQTRKQIDLLKKKVEFLKLESNPTGDDISSIIIRAGLSKMQPNEKEAYIQGKLEEYERTNQTYVWAEEMWEKNNIIGLLEVFKIKKFNQPMLSARLDNNHEMKVLTNTFHRKEIDKWADMDFDQTYKYAQIEVEKEYPI
jgi:hypothetical protein